MKRLIFGRFYSIPYSTFVERDTGIQAPRSLPLVCAREIDPRVPACEPDSFVFGRGPHAVPDVTRRLAVVAE